MVKVRFNNLIRSKYRVTETTVHPGTLTNIINQIIEQYPTIRRSDLESAIIFHNNQPIGRFGFHKVINDGEEIMITHFVGGG